MRTRADPTSLIQMALNLSINARDALIHLPPHDARGLIRLQMTPISDADRAGKLDFCTLVKGPSMSGSRFQIKGQEQTPKHATGSSRRMSPPMATKAPDWVLL